MGAKLERPAVLVAKSLVLAAAGLAAAGNLPAQGKTATVPDAQVESNVLKALAANSKLADQQISSAAVYGVVTLSGHVKDEATRSLAEEVVSRTSGVQKVVDELTLADQGTPAVGQTPPTSDQGQLQSDGTYAPAIGAQAAGQPPPSSQSQTNESQLPPTYNPQAGPSGTPDAQNSPAGPPPPDTTYGANQAPYSQQGQPAYGQQGQPPQDQPGPYPGGNPGRPPYSQQGQPPYGQQGQPPYGQQSPYGQAGPPPYGQGGQPSYGQNGQSPYGPPTQSPYGQPGAPSQRAYAQGDGRYVGQPGGQVVSVPAGATLQLRMNEGIDSKHAQIGSSFSGTVIRDVVANGFVAIPRGAAVQGSIVDATRGGAIKGHATLALQLTQVTLGGRAYPLTSNVWEQDGLDKTGRTVGSAVGLGVVGAIIGGVAGGGAGAAIGAGAGGVAGIGASAASPNSQAFLPPEAIVTFQLTQPVTLTTVSQAEMERLGYGIPSGAPQQMRRRYPPPPPPYYYGPGYYYAPRAYYRPYPY